MVDKKQVLTATKKTFALFIEILPFFLSILLLISLYVTLIPKGFYNRFFTTNSIIDSFIGALIGSISTGHPVTSYIIGGELLKAGIGLVAVIAFILSWVTVGIIQLPAECYFLGKRFGIIRNSLSFLFAIIISILMLLTLRAFGR
ncbi:MAG: hypothetical protein B5M53_08730 [Candidatus Cloacimonas sp. 4484_209]|nr:MAG: hypothetical protein B5M53_08730 [Candidatus Cloacimonas sp. 4484_209]